jgi:alkaline phosphatase D
MKKTSPTRSEITRRRFIETSAAAAASLPLCSIVRAAEDGAEPPHQATGVKVGEVTDSSAIVWTRLTAAPSRNKGGLAPAREEPKDSTAADVSADQMEGACPGAQGRVRLRYGTREDLSDAQETDWAEALAATDFTHHFQLRGLKPSTVYHYVTETTGPGGAPKHGSLRGKFETAPAAESPSDFTFCVMSCQGYPDRDHADGHNIYPSMLSLAPKFVSFTGDVVYYDNDAPRAVNARLARLHWERMFSLPRQVELLRNAASYWLKDDHDTLKNDSWPGASLGLLSFEEGQRIFREQTPMSEKGYRTFRWGRDVQIWLTDGRDYRSPNNMPDGPEKTIWGAEQKEWFKRTVKASDATWKVLISPTPLVGPDRAGKNDNHANKGFTHEGDEIRQWLQANVPDNFFVLCGDRHWQFHSVHPATGVQEFSVGAASDKHAGGSPGEDKTYHRFHRVKGGFLSVTLQPDANHSTITFRHHDVHGAVVYQWKHRLPVA